MCSIENCGCDNFEDKDKCILHCEKDDNKNYTNLFYDKLRELLDSEIDKINIQRKEIKKNSSFDFNILWSINFINIHFPKSNLHSVFYFDDFRNYNIYFESCVFYSEEKKILHSFLNNLTFKECIFKKDVDFSNSNFKESINFSGSIFEKKLIIEDAEFIENVFFNNITIKDKLKLDNTIFRKQPTFMYLKLLNGVKNRETARIIKDFFEQQNNIIEANKFYSLEMKERDKELKWKENFLDKLVFKAHGIFSNHSQDWILPIIWIFIIGMFTSFIDIQLFNAKKINDTVNPFYIFVFSIFFGVYHLISAYKDWSYYYYTYVGSLLGIGYIYLTNDYLFTNFSKTVNPFSVMKSGEDLNIIQLFFKIIIAYLIYQLVVSIRQNTRRK